MADDKKRKAVPWLRIIDDYAHGRGTQAEIAKRYGIAEETLTRRKKRDEKAGKPWPSISGTADEIKALTFKVNDQRQERSKIVNDAEKEALQNALAQHAQIEADMFELAKQMLQDARSGTLIHKNGEAEAQKIALESAAKVLATSRDLHGLKAGQASVTDGADGQKRIIFEIAAPPEEATA